MTASFSAELTAAGEPLLEAQLAHPFVRGIADGSLDADRFRHYVRQDYVFLVEYARLLALGCARAPRLDDMERFADLAQGVLRTEMDLHRSYAAEWGIGREELEREAPAPTTRAYTDFLLRTAALRDYAELVAALLPCMWGYHALGRRLAEGPPPGEERYARWIETYASAEFGELAGWCLALTDEVAAGAGEETRARMREAFLTSAGFELRFWEMAWTLEGRGTG